MGTLQYCHGSQWTRESSRGPVGACREDGRNVEDVGRTSARNAIESEAPSEEEQEEQSKPNPIDEEKLKEMKISEEKALLILEAMKNNEVQYIQQNKRKAKKKKDPSKPDW